jgi:2-polyprenyl-3-methyl-5-hydroxy-6-metoxy-1,4-benzoquinol methylase
MNPEPSTKQFYEAYWSEAVPAPTRDPWRPIRWKLLRDQLDRTALAGNRLLDCGAGEGSLLAEAQRWGLEAVGLEISDRAAERARALHGCCRIIVHSVERRPWPVPSGTFDVVVALEVIEHLLLPRELVIGAYEALRPGGYLALTTPYHGVLKNLALAVKGFDRHFAAEGPHVRFFSDPALRRLLEQTGFHMRALQHFGRLPWLWAGAFVWAQKA